MLSTVVVREKKKSPSETRAENLPAGGVGKVTSVEGLKTVRDSGCFHSHSGSNGRELHVALAESHAAGSTAPSPGRLWLQAAHYLLGCRYWCMNMLSSLSIQPPLFLSNFALL